MERLEKIGKVAGASMAIFSVAAAITSFLMNTLVVEPLREEIEELREDHDSTEGSVQALNTWRSAEEEHSRAVADILRERLSGHELAMMELRGSIEALRIELRFSSGGSPLAEAAMREPSRPPSGGGDDLLESLPRIPAGARRAPRSLLEARGMTDAALDSPPPDFAGDPLGGMESL